MDNQYQLKLDMYEAGAYRMPVPPVLTTYWSTRDWINFIDAQGVWDYNTYNHLYSRVEYPREGGYRMESSPLPDWIFLVVSKVGDTKYVTVYSQIHVNKKVTMPTSYSASFSDREIIIDVSGTISKMFL